MSGADESVVDILTQYGERLGTAFQLADDVLDIASDSHESGKTPGTDLREGIPTLPVLRLREMAERDGREEDLELVRLLDGDLTDDARHAEVLSRLRVHPALERARRDTVQYAQDARATLAPLPECFAKSALEELCDAVVHRGQAERPLSSGTGPSAPGDPYGSGVRGPFRVIPRSYTHLRPGADAPQPPLWSDGVINPTGSGERGDTRVAAVDTRGQGSDMAANTKTSRKAARYAVPVAVAGVAAATVAMVPAFANAGGPDLPKVTAQQLIEKVAASDVQQLTGTAKLSTDLGLPTIASGLLGGGGIAGARPIRRTRSRSSRTARTPSASRPTARTARS